jgi:hypothetical protein
MPPPPALLKAGRGCTGVFILVIGVPHLLVGLGVTLSGLPMGMIFILSGTFCCLLAGTMFGIDWRKTLVAVLGVMVAAVAVAVATQKPG